MNLATLMTDTAQRHPERTALVVGAQSLTYADLEEASARVAGLVASHGVAPGDRVALMLPNGPAFAVIYYGILRAGGAVVPMNPLLKAREIQFYLEDSGATVLFAGPTNAEDAATAAQRTGSVVITADDGFEAMLAEYDAVPDVVERDAEDTAVLLYTSGTTGKPKGAELTHDNLSQNTASARDLFGLESDDVVFGGLPLFHSFGQTCTLNTTMAAGARLVLLPRFDAGTALGLLAEHRVSVFAGVPTMYSAFLAVSEAPDLPDLRLCVSGGAALPAEVLNRFEQQFGCQVLEGYGLSETSPLASFNTREGHKAGSIGTPIPGVEMRIVGEDGEPLPDGEVGEIAIRGHNVMKGYWQRPEATEEVLSTDGWFRTGDVGRRDEDGFYFIVDRKKDLIIRGGFNVYPREIEEVLYEHPAVAEAAVIGVPHPELGEEIVAVVALAGGASAEPDELRQHVKDQVAPYKYPRHVVLVEALPKGPTGKILKREIELPDDLTAAR